MEKEEIKNLFLQKKLNIHKVIIAFCESKEINTKQKFDAFIDELGDFFDNYRESLPK
jgi:hypothetical protein